MVSQVPQDIDLGAVLACMRRTIDKLELEFSQLAASFAKDDQWDLAGSNSPIDWIRFNCHMTSNAVADRISVGERVAEMPESTQALMENEIGFARLTVMARTAKALGEGFSETALLEQARENSPGKFHFRCLHYRHVVNAL